jgi:Phosphopantetheine attachment site/AMP-binding enzyme C-terminal domain/AMP-binding enzyme
MLNAYGPTECSDDVSHQIIMTAPGEEEVARGVPVGKAIGNMRVYVLNRQQELQPVGIAGEVYVGGVGVGRGYVGDAIRTAEVFMPDPWSEVAGGRMYRTGDVGKYRADGAIEYLGRTDQQVKVRGYRIELGEIEAVLKEFPAVQECVVVARAQTSGDKRLVAYLVARPHAVAKSSEVYDHLKERLPEYMLPSSFVLLDALPLLPNGKLDRQALPDPGEDVVRGDVEYVAPRTPLEEQLAAIWAEVLALKQVGIYDNFFTIGGHSLLITQVLARVRDAFEVTLSVRTLFKNPTIAGLAEAIERARSRSTELRKQTVVSISRDAYRQKRSSLVTPSDKSR